MGITMAEENLNLTGESVGRAHRVLEHTQDQPPQNQHLKEHNPLWEVRKLTKHGARAKQAALFPL